MGDITGNKVSVSSRVRRIETAEDPVSSPSSMSSASTTVFEVNCCWRLVAESVTNTKKCRTSTFHLSLCSELAQSCVSNVSAWSRKEGAGEIWNSFKCSLPVLNYTDQRFYHSLKSLKLLEFFTTPWNSLKPPWIQKIIPKFLSMLLEFWHNTVSTAVRKLIN